MKPKNCICGNNKAHTMECKRHQRNVLVKKYNKTRRTKMVEKHLCLNCGKEIKPDLCPHCKEIIGYKRRCKKCLEKTNGK